MFSFQSTLIDSYRWAMLPSRALHRFWMNRQGTLPLAVLFYHRVSDQDGNEWTISRHQFQRQIQWLSDNFELVSLSEIQRRVVSNHNSNPTVSITFDDGYAENCEWALPHLIERQIPVTYFVTLSNILEQAPFAHDVESGLPLAVNSLEQIRGLAAAGIEIGGHTRTHANLGSITEDDRLFDESIAATKELAALIGAPINYFAFPFGQLKNLNRRVFQLAKANGLKGVCSAYGGFNFPGGDAFHIKRIHGDKNFSRLRNWLSYDKRIFRAPEFNY